MELCRLCVYLEKEEGTNDGALGIHDVDAGLGFASEVRRYKLCPKPSFADSIKCVGLCHGYLVAFRDQDSSSQPANSI